MDDRRGPRTVIDVEEERRKSAVMRREQEAASAMTADQSGSLLVELYDLKGSDGRSGESHWVQMARWIKYEEDVEGVDGHWGRPHVPFLSYHSMHQLTTYMNNGVILLELEANNAAEITDAMMEGLCEQYELSDEGTSLLSNMFGRMSKRSRAERKFTMAGLTGTLNRPQPAIAINKESSTGIAPSDNLRRHSLAPWKYTNTRRQDTDESSLRRSSVAFNIPPAPDRSLGRKLSHQLSQQLSHLARSMSTDTVTACETAQVFAGSSDDLTDVQFCMIRLKRSLHIPDWHDTVPIRFVFVILGPPMPDLDYHELGRALCTMLSNPTFRDVSYSARDKAELVRGLHEFMDSAVLLPPGDVQRDDLINTDDVRRALRQRKHQKEDAIKRMSLAARLSAVGIQRGESEKGAETDQRFQEIEKEKASSTPHQRLPWERTRRPFGGLIEDIKNRLPLYISDFKDALHLQSISAVIFMFFVVFSPSISFGQVMNHQLEGYMGITEVFVAQCLCGVLWSLFAGQPLLMQVATGPFLVFESALFQFCKRNHLEFLVVRVWVAFWTFLLTVLMAMVEASFLIGYVTRFTQDIFTCLIAGIFVFEAGKFVGKTFHVHPLLSATHYCSLTMEQVDPHQILLNGTFSILRLNKTFNHLPADIVSPTILIHKQPNTALLSVIFVIGTFYVAFVLKKIRMSHYFGRRIRKALGDFGVPVTIFLMVLLYRFIFSETYLQPAEMHSNFGLTRPDLRPWFIHPFGISKRIPTWVVFAAIIPATLVCILLFAEIEIIELLLSGKDRGLKKPMGFHWDLVLGGALMFLNTLIGLPWMCAAAVQSLTHATALTVMKRAAPGEKPQVDYVVEQRVTTMIVAILIGACSFLGSVLSVIPIAVLLGVFLYLGITCLMSIQFCHRIILFIIPQKYFPDQPYCSEVSMWRMHLYTFLQLIGFIVLWIVNMIPESSLAFPFVIALDAVARRYLFPKIFTAHELQALDASDIEKKSDEKDEDDIYDETSMPP